MGKSQVNCGVDFPAPGSTREKVDGAVKQHNPVSHAEQRQARGSNVRFLSPRLGPLSYVDLESCHYSGYSCVTL